MAAYEREFFVEGIKVALIHTAVNWKDKNKNVSKLLDLNKRAACEGAQIIVNPELATSGYAFKNRNDIALLTETIPGPTTEALGQICKEYGSYICIGLPEVDVKTGIFYNAAAVIGPNGQVIGKYRKVAPVFKENLWAAEGNLPPLVIPTEYGKFGVVICSDAYYYKPVRAAVLQGARLLLVPVNWPANYNNPENYWRARATENGIYMLICNRTGLDPGMDCSSGESFIINNHGKVITKIRSAYDTIIYDILPLRNGQFISTSEDLLVQRRPRCYGNISLATFSHLNSESLLGLPEAADSIVATVQYRPVKDNPELNRDKMLELIDKSVDMANARRYRLDLLIFPELSVTGNISGYREADRLCEKIPGTTTEAFISKAREKHIYIIIGMAERNEGEFYNSSVLIGPDGIEGVYQKVHLTSSDKRWAEGGSGFPVFDLPFGRIGILMGYDLMFPESSECLAKLGTDLVCVPCIWREPDRRFIWQARVAEQMHLAIANQWGENEVFYPLGKSSILSYSMDPERRQILESPEQNDDINLMRLSMKDTRVKQFVEKINYDVLLSMGDRFNDRS